MATIFQFPYRTVAEVSLRAVLKNLATLRTYCQREVLPVVKADAYGHGMVAVAKTLVSRGSVQMLCVATLEEAIELRKKLPHGVGILVLSGFLPHQLEAFLKYQLIPVIHSLAHLKALLGRTRLPEVHLKLDTGMHRLGITEDEMNEALRVTSKLNIKLAGLMTHLAESESTTSHFSDEQIARFEEMQKAFREKKLLATDARIHLANSGGILRKKLGSSNAVRPGLSLYGVYPNPRWEGPPDLVPVLSWRARVLCLKVAKRNDTVGYGRTYKVKRKERLAILPIGYADGYPRLLSNQGEVLIHGRRVPIRGRVSMDLTTVDASSAGAVREGTVVTLLGQDGDDKITAWNVAEWAETIPYEVFCGISARVPRVYYE